jgi:hypothetical protein
MPRDNVIYELGLFSGALGPERCFIVAPRGSDIHLPTDLLGMTVGEYHANRSDGNLRAAVGPFCGDVRDKLRALGFAIGAVQEELCVLAAKFECCEWIIDRTNAEPVRVEEKRVEEKKRILANMVSFCRDHPINKGALTEEQSPSFAVALAAAVTASPANGDAKALLRIPSDSVARGVVQSAMFEAVLALDRNGKISVDERSNLIQWAESFCDSHSSLVKAIADFKARVR